MLNSILVVCIGNICRSPTGERLLRERLPGKIIDSAGIAAVVNYSADAKAAEVAAEHNLSLIGHKARQLTADMCRKYELILVMEKRHIYEVTRISPESRGKVMLFGQWLDDLEIADPYQESLQVFTTTFQQLSQSADLWAKALQ